MNKGSINVKSHPFIIASVVEHPDQELSDMIAGRTTLKDNSGLNYQNCQHLLCNLICPS